MPSSAPGRPIVGIEPELAGIRDPMDRALGWAGVFALVALLFPIQRESGGARWIWHAWVFGESVGAGIAHLVAGIALLLISRARRPRLDKAALSLGALAIATAFIVTDPGTSRDLLILFPRPLVSLGLLFPAGVALGAAAIAWRTGPFAARRASAPAIALAIASNVATLALLVLPQASGTVLGSIFDAGDQVVHGGGPDAFRASMLTVALLALLPIALSLFAMQAVLQRTVTGSAVAWTLAIPPAVIFTLGFKGSIAYGDVSLLLLGLRTAVLFSSFTLAASFSIVGASAQLLDPLGSEATRPTRLLRDALLFDVLEAARQTGQPRIARTLEGYRGTVIRLVRARFSQLLEDVRAERDPPRSWGALILRMRAHLLDDVDPSDPRPPRASALVQFLGRRRNLELALAFSALACGGLIAGIDALDVPRATEWPLAREEDWMTELYERRLPMIGVAAGGTEYPGRSKRIRRTVDAAAELAKGRPELERAIRKLAPIVIDLPEERRSVAHVADEINDIARASGIPFFLDTDVLGVKRGGAFLYFLYVKSYRIDRVRHAKQGRGEYTALWVTRADHTNVIESRLGWTRHDARHGMVVLDVVRDYWTEDVAPAIAGLGAGPVQAIYSRHAEALESDLAGAIAARIGVDEGAARMALKRRLACLEEEADACRHLASAVDAVVVEILAEKVETHELQHVMDGMEVPHPEALLDLMPAHSEDSITFAAAELSAYLAEVARSPQPRIALVHFLALAATKPHSPEGYAGRIALERLAIAGESPDELLDLPEAELRARATAAHETLFGGELRS
jgi:hypothetical protein